MAETYEAKNDLDSAITVYIKIADLYGDNVQLSIRALLRAARIYEDKDDFKSALGLYSRILQYKTEESRFAQERIDWIKVNIK